MAGLLPGKIQFRVVGLLSLIIALFVAGSTVMENAAFERLALLEQNAAGERQSLFDKLLALKGQPLKTYAYDYSYWDELVAFVRSRDPEWARINLDQALASQKLAGAWVYNADFEPLYASRKPVPDLFPAGPLPPAVLRDLARDRPFPHFFIETPRGLLEIRAAPIQPSADAERRTPAQGYLLVGQFWDAEYLNNLSELIGGTVTLRPASATADQVSDRAVPAVAEFTRILPGPAGQPAAVLTVRCPLAFGQSIREFLAWEHYLCIAFGLLLLIALCAALFLWVSRPLRRLSHSLAQRDSTLLGPLFGDATEFGQLARLVRDFFQQQQQLTREIQERGEREAILRQYSRALEQSANIVVITDRDGAIEYVNPKFVQVTGYSREEAIGANPRILKSGKHSRAQYQYLWQTITSGHEWRGEFQNRRKDGGLYWESASIAPIRDEHGAITHFVAIKEDITRRKRIEAALHANELKYRSVFATVGDALFLIDSRNGRILTVNPAACKLYGYSREEFLTLKDTDLADVSSADVSSASVELPRTVSQRLTNCPHRRKDGTVFPTDIWVRHFTYRGYKITVAAIRDMTAQKRAEQRIVRLSHFYAALSRTSATIMRYAEPRELFERICQIVVDLEQIRMVWIGFVDSETGWFQPLAHAGAAPDYPRYLADHPISGDPGLPEGRGPTGMAFRLGEPVVSNDFLADPDNQFWQGPASALGIRAGAAFPLRRNGQVVGCLSAYAAERDYFEADVTGLLTNLAGEVSFALDLLDREAQRQAAEERISHMAGHDPLTGLPNRTLLLDRINQAIHGAHRRQRCVGVLFLDLDHFKTINDSLGHEVGDELLKAVTERLRGRLRQEDTLARQGGDEFILVLPDIIEPAAAGQVAEYLLEALREPFLLNGQSLHINASIGISIYPLDAADPPTLIRFADHAMYQIKSAGRGNYTFFTPELNVRMSELLALGNELRRALERDEFVLHYQPLVELATGRLVAVEALIRWQHPERGLMAPGDFLPIAEETGLIDPIGAWTLRAACAQNRRWRDAGLSSVPVAVNLSARQWLQPRIEDHVVDALESAGLAPSLLELEIGESLLRDTDKTLATMGRLRARGIGFAVDDFGIGLFNLGLLKRSPVNRLKIAPSFVRDISTDAAAAAITTTIIQLGRNLRLQVVAEGVETPEQARLLRELGCDIAQGYHFGGPLPAGECEALLGRSWTAC
jgi:diguanylate cyclase (GGDEF)-like protein/PAS domain S-box-containing protein